MKKTMGLNVGDVMSGIVKTVDMDVKVTLVRELFINQLLKYLVVIDPSSESVIGIITQSDILKIPEAVIQGKKMMFANHIMKKSFSSVSKMEAIETAASIMLRESLNIMPVLDHNHDLVGVITGSDLLRAAYQWSNEQPCSKFSFFKRLR